MITAFSGTISATLVYALSSQTESSSGHCSSSNHPVSNLYTLEAQKMNHYTADIHNTLNNYSSGHRSFILPFTIGGFLYIALVGIIPEIVEEADHNVSLKQLFYFIVGVLFIFLLTQIEALIPYLI